MNGKVYGRQPRIEVPLILPDQRHIAIEFVIDTGFDGFLMLPSNAILDPKSRIRLPLGRVRGKRSTDS